MPRRRVHRYAMPVKDTRPHQGKGPAEKPVKLARARKKNRRSS